MTRNGVQTMKEMYIYEPAKAMERGKINPELELDRQRITITSAKLKNFGVILTCYDYRTHGDEFMINPQVNDRIRMTGMKCLPITLVDGRVMKQGSYPTQKEIIAWLQIPAEFLEEETEGCCGGGCSGCSCH